MTISDDIRSQVRQIFASQWTEREGRVVPDSPDVGLGNDAIKLDATVLYADLAESTAMVNTKTARFAAGVYKAYLASACRVIREQGGTITSFDGDRVMAVFIGESKNSDAATAGLKINHVVSKILNEELRSIYKDGAYQVKQVVGIDTSTLLVARTGIRGANDLVWVGPAANYAAKLCAIRDGTFSTWITERVFTRLKDAAKNSQSGPMWERRLWTTQANMPIYASAWTYPL